MGGKSANCCIAHLPAFTWVSFLDRFVYALISNSVAGKRGYARHLSINEVGDFGRFSDPGCAHL